MIPWTSAQPSRLFIALGLGLVLSACGDDPTSPSSSLPDPTGATVWAHIQEADYQMEWWLWPGKGQQYVALAPHDRITIYMNDVALLALQQGASSMPNGSFVVAENYDEEGSIRTITTMYKYPSYNPEANNWFWLENDPEGTVIQDGKVQGCIGCHSGAETTDYLWTPLR